MAARTDLRIRLAPAARSPRQARKALDSALPRGLHDEARATVMLLVSELVTNAVLHVGAEVDVDVHAETPGKVRVDVCDPSPYPPRVRDPQMSSTGRGMNLLDALADRWGVDVRNGGKSVWFELDLPERRSTPR